MKFSKYYRNTLYGMLALLLGAEVLASDSINNNSTSPPPPGTRSSSGGGDSPRRASDPETHSPEKKAEHRPSASSEEEFDPEKTTHSVRTEPNYRSNRAVDPANAGFQTIGQYVSGASRFLQEQKNARDHMLNFRKKMAEVAAQHRALERQYAQKEAESRAALARMNQAPIGEKGNPVASRQFVPDSGSVAAAPAPVPTSFPSLSGFNFGSQAQLQGAVEAAAPVALARNEAKPAAVDMSVFEGNLAGSRNEQQSAPVQESTIAVVEVTEQAAGKPAQARIASVKGKGMDKNGKKSLRDALKAALARQPASTAGGIGKGAEKDAESKTQNAARTALEQLVAESERDFAAGGGRFESALAGYNAGGINGGSFGLDNSETAAEVARLKSEVQERQSAPEVLGKESQDLFERVRVAHMRSIKDGRVSLLHR